MTEQMAIDVSNKIETVLVSGDLSRLSPEERVQYYRAVCQSVGLNPLTRPFDYITLNGKLTLYARKDATDQLRKIHCVSIEDVSISELNDNYTVIVKGRDASGRTDVEIGVVSKRDMQGNTANAQMKAVTKAKRRLTLSLCGLGMLDETEIETIPNAKISVIDDSGEMNPALPTVSEMTLEEAMAMTDSKGRIYGDMTNDELSKYAYGINKALRGGELDNRRQETYLRKLQAIKLIDDARNNSGQSTLDLPAENGGG